ncbi:adenylate kinase [Chloroflexota bacterium]
MPIYIVLLGPPGAGKGTQAQIISKELNLPHISSGDIFRENLKNQTEMGIIAERYMTRGELVPDDITISMIRDRLTREDCKPGGLLDGFPRTPAQAAALDNTLAEFRGKVNAVPYIKVPQEVLIERLTGRWTCRAEGHIFHERFNPPRQKGVCDYDGSQLYQRDDDTEETVKNRIQVYFKQTMPLIDYYRQAGLLLEVDGRKPIEKVGADLIYAISKAI